MDKVYDHVSRWAMYVVAVVAALALGMAIPRAGSTSPPKPTNADIMHQLSVIQQELSRKSDHSENDVLRQIAERLEAKIDESSHQTAAGNPQRAGSKSRQDEADKQLARLLRYVKDVEKSIAKVDTSLST